MSAKKSAAILIGHGSLLGASGSAMLRIAARLRASGVLPIVEAGFLNYSRPTLAEAVSKCHNLGAGHMIVQPYFLIAGAYVMTDLPNLVQRVAAQYDDLRFTIGQVLGGHSALVKLAGKRLAAVDSLPAPSTGLLFVAHGTPLEQANLPIMQVLQQTQKQAGYGAALIGYLDCNQPDIPTAFAQLVQQGVRRIAVLPYFLHLGRHVRKDLPALFAQAQVDYPQVEICIAEHLGYDPLLIDATAERILEAGSDTILV